MIIYKPKAISSYQYFLINTKAEYSEHTNIPFK